MSQEGSHYYVPAPSTWPMTGSIALFFMGFGAAFSVNKMPVGYAMLTLGFAILFYMLFGWFRTVARESESGKFNKQVDASFRWGMSWFILSEVMFFGAFFGALYYMRAHSIPDLGDLNIKCCGRISRRTGPQPGPASPRNSSPWARGACRQSIPSCC